MISHHFNALDTYTRQNLAYIVPTLSQFCEILNMRFGASILDKIS